ncbi:MAG TPA: hypothetical protein VFR90_07525 [Methylibium sp.]|uniref:hypothetical protein n=1 Tax=Methylibium sp. TaxID=2067992 RepID=UPI002DC00BF0|nr:hypothetical protein [Methylibium sp.]HEU4458956.1 hypothetical protein [Methylibium sp.]
MSPRRLPCDPRRRDALAALLALACAPAARAARQRVDDDGLRLGLDLPSDWIPIPRAEIVEAGERARAAGADSAWTVRAAWQRVPHQRWFTLPHLLLESRPSAQAPATRPARGAHELGRAGARSVHRHRASWSQPGLELQLTLLAWDDERELFDAIVASLETG